MNTPNNAFSRMSCAVQSNTILNRAVLNTLGFSVPYSLNANNWTEAKERLLANALYTVVAFASPFFMLPRINKLVMKKGGLIENFEDKAVELVRVSKGYLNEDAAKMVKGIKEKAKEFGLQSEFNKILNKFSDKETLRQKLIECHKNIFKLDFLTTSVGITTIPWAVQYFTKLTTGRKGFSGEFKMAGEEYTDRQTESHEKNKYKKMALSYISAVAPALIIPGYLAKSMKSAPQQLGRVGKWAKKHAENFDYKDGKFMSMLTYATMWFTGDLPSFMLAARDKHELQYIAVAYPILGTFYFIGDRLLNNVFGRLLDKHKGSNIMNRKGYENVGFFKKLIMPMKSLNEITDHKALKYAQRIYWGNMLITAASLGVIMPQALNRVLKKNVEEDLAKQNPELREDLRNIFNSNSYIDITKVTQDLSR